MITTDDLTMLVKSLGKSEKRYIQMLSSLSGGAGEKDYLELFSIIDKGKFNNEREIFAQFQKTPSKKKYYNIRAYLYKHILRCMQFYHHESSPFLETLSDIQANKFLLMKGLVKQAGDVIEDAQNRAERYELYPLLGDIYLDKANYERITNNQFYSDTNLRHKYYDKIIEGAGIETLHTQIRKLYYDLVTVITYKVSFDLNYYKNEINKYAACRTHRSFTIRTLYRVCESYLFRLLGKKEGMTKCLEDVYEEFKKNPRFIESQGNRYVSVAYSVALFNTELKNYDIAERCLLELREISEKYFLKKQNSPYASVAFSHIVSGELFFLIATLQLEKIFDLLPWFNEGVKKYGKSIVPRSLINSYYNISFVFFVLQDYDQALTYLNRSLNIRAEKIEHLYPGMRFYEIIILIERDEFELIESKLNSLSYFIKKQKINRALEEGLIKEFSKLYSSYGKENAKAVFKRMLKELNENEDFVLSSNQKLVISTWVESKLNKRTYFEQMKRNIELSAAKYW